MVAADRALVGDGSPQFCGLRSWVDGVSSPTNVIRHPYLKHFESTSTRVSSRTGARRNRANKDNTKRAIAWINQQFARVALPQTARPTGPRRPFRGVLGPLPIVWRVSAGIGYDPKEGEGSTQHGHRPPVHNYSGRGEGPTRPSHCSLLPCRSPCAPHYPLPVGLLPCYPMSNLTAALIAGSHLRGPPCHRPVLPKGNRVGRAQGGRCILRPPVVGPPAQP